MKWINSEERKPEDARDVLGLYADGHMDVVCYEGIGWYDGKYKNPMPKVTYWQYLPPPPASNNEFKATEAP